MVRKRSVKSPSNKAKKLSKGLAPFVSILNRLESEVEDLLAQPQKHLQNRKAIMKNLNQLKQQFDLAGIKKRASQTGNQVSREFKNAINLVRENIEANVTDAEFIGTVRENVNGAIKQVQDSAVLEVAKDRMIDTKEQVFGMLNIPSKQDIDTLTRKVSALEKKLSSIKNQKARR